MDINNKKTFNTRLNAIITWFKFKKELITLWWMDAPKWQIDLTKGSYYMRKGAMYQVGQPFTTVNPITKAKKKRYINNLFFNFKENKITHSFSNRPVPGFTEQFEYKKAK